MAAPQTAAAAGTRVNVPPGVYNQKSELALVDDNETDASFTELLQHRAPAIAATGATGRNVPTFTDVASQRDATWMLRRGFRNASSSDLDQTVTAMSYGFAHEKADGSFQYNLSDLTQAPSDAAFFLESFGSIYDGLQASPGMLPQLKNAMTWLSSQTAALRRRPTMDESVGIAQAVMRGQS